MEGVLSGCRGGGPKPKENKRYPPKNLLLALFNIKISSLSYLCRCNVIPRLKKDSFVLGFLASLLGFRLAWLPACLASGLLGLVLACLAVSYLVNYDLSRTINPRIP